MTLKNKTIKLISAILIISIVAPVALFFQPKQASAISACPPGTPDLKSVPIVNMAIKGATGTTCITTVKEWVQKLLEIARMAIAKKVIEKITQSTIAWINSGFHGSPLFLENPESFFKDIAKSELRTMVDMFGYDRLKFPFGRDFALNAINSYKSTLERNASYTLSSVMNQQQAEAFRNDFNVGGWNGFLINTQYPQNNYMGFQMMANEELARRLQGTSQPPALEIKAQLEQGNGFLSPQNCPTNSAYNNGVNEWNQPSFDTAAYNQSHPYNPPSGVSVGPKTPEQQAMDAAYDETYQMNLQNTRDSWAQTNTCPGGLQNTTPGSVVANQIMMSMSSSVRQSELAMALGNSLSAIFDALLNKFLGDGLNALTNAVSSQPSTDNWSYDGVTLDGDVNNPPVIGALVIPQNVSVNVNQSTSTNISGGTAPYRIETPSDATVANAQISGSALTITGIAPGETTTVVKDSSLPIKRVTVRITIVDPDGLMVLPASIKIGINDNLVTTISGGEKPYRILVNPNETIATALLDDTILIVTGITAGQTSLVIKDSSSTPKTATVNITIINNQTEGPTVTLSADPLRIQPGQSSTLSWTSQNTTSCSSSSLGLRTVPLNGETTVSPTSTTTYDITCYDRNGEDTTDSTTVTVAGSL
ncbi:MAG: hypothetical protein WC870_00765 [Candidatus Paceibacterota bacterium]